jgi:hypothetical protein
MRMPRVTSLVVLAFAAPFIAPLPARAECEPAIASIDPSVSRIDTGGQWEHGGKKGVFRDVGWGELEKDSKARSTVIATRYIKEIGDLTNISDVRFVYASGTARIEVRHLVEGDPKLHWVRCFTLGPDGTYAHREGPCPGAKRPAPP